VHLPKDFSTFPFSPAVNRISRGKRKGFPSPSRNEGDEGPSVLIAAVCQTIDEELAPPDFFPYEGLQQLVRSFFSRGKGREARLAGDTPHSLLPSAGEYGNALLLTHGTIVEVGTAILLTLFLPRALPRIFSPLPISSPYG